MDRVIYMNKGSIKFFGTPKEIENKDFYKDIIKSIDNKKNKDISNIKKEIKEDNDIYKINKSEKDIIRITKDEEQKKGRIKFSVWMIFFMYAGGISYLILTIFTNRILYILGFEYFYKNYKKMGNLVSSNNNYQLKRVFYKYNGFSTKDYLFFLNLNKFEYRNYRSYLQLDKDNFNGIMENQENRILVFTEYVLRYLENLKYYFVNMDLCGCSLNGECSLEFFPYEIYVSPQNNILYCMRNDVYNKKCLNVKHNSISNKKNVNKFFIKDKQFFNSNKCDNQDYNHPDDDDSQNYNYSLGEGNDED
jgi:hypothetical protein